MGVYDKTGTVLTSIYQVNGSPINTAYDVSGEIVYPGVDYDDYTISSLYNLGVQNCQGIAVFNNVLFQFRAGGSITDKVCLFDFTDGSEILSDMVIESDHGDSATFSNEFYDPGDEFPLLYVTADTSPAKIYINRVSRSSASLIKTLSFPLTAGYYGAGAFDWDNSICYLLSYKKQNYQTDDGGTNTTVVSKWDLSNLADNGGGSYTPEFISQYERDFIYVMQGLTFHDGLIWITSGYGSTPSHIYAMEPATGVIKHTITMNDNIEIEGAQFIYDNVTQSYYLLTAQQSGRYKKVTFAEA